jgi:hypothetical protein
METPEPPAVEEAVRPVAEEICEQDDLEGLEPCRLERDDRAARVDPGLEPAGAERGAERDRDWHDHGDGRRLDHRLLHEGVQEPVGEISALAAPLPPAPAGQGGPPPLHEGEDGAGEEQGDGHSQEALRHDDPSRGGRRFFHAGVRRRRVERGRDREGHHSSENRMRSVQRNLDHLIASGWLERDDWTKRTTYTLCYAAPPPAALEGVTTRGVCCRRVFPPEPGGGSDRARAAAGPRGQAGRMTGAATRAMPATRPSPGAPRQACPCPGARRRWRTRRRGGTPGGRSRRTGPPSSRSARRPGTRGRTRRRAARRRP